MPLADPLPLSEFHELLGIANVSFEVQERSYLQETEQGAVITGSYGDPLWGGAVQTVALRQDRGATSSTARLNMLKSGHKFLMFPPQQPFPQSDPQGTTLTGTVTVVAISADRREINLTGLPANFVVTMGDFISFEHAGRYYFFQVMTGGTAGGGGALTDIEVFPPISDAVVAPLTANMRYPYLRAALVPQTARGPQYANIMGSGASYRWVQAV